MEYTIQGQKINIDLDENVFSPSPHGSSALGESIKINSEELVLDIGTGTGLLAILAAKLGGKVTAVDILPEAVELAKNNFNKNEVNIDIKISDLFSSIEQKYDVIIANVPQEILSPKIIESSNKNKIIGMHGGEKGNEILLKVLRDSPSYMNQDSRLYIVVYSLSNFRESLSKILTTYNAKLINFYTGPVKDFLYDDIEWYENQLNNGLIDIYKKEEKYFADIFVFELKLK
jgi:release factor glutamine methyltransferase